MPLSDLKPQDQQFVRHYIREGNATKAYQATHPRSKSYKGSSVNGSRKLAEPSIKRVLQEELSLDDLKSEMHSCLDLAKKQKSLKEIRGSVMDYAKLAGVIVDKQEVTQLTTQQVEETRRLVLETVKTLSVST